MSKNVTLLVLTYNQERFVDQAVASVLSQTGEPIKIHISDDASTDRTFEIIEDLVSKYSGPHCVEIFRNAKNLGLAAHVNTCMSRIDTDWTIASAGDDISLPNRVERIRAFIQSSDALLVHSRFLCLDEASYENDDCLRSINPYFLHDTSALGSADRLALYVGATGAWNRLLFEKYGNIGEGCYEDLILGFRAALERRVGFVDEVLVKYRVGVGISTKSSEESSDPRVWAAERTRDLRWRIAVLDQRLKDTYRSDHPQKKRISKKIERKLLRTKLRLKFFLDGQKNFLRKNWRVFFLAYSIRASERKKAKRAGVR